MQGHNVTGFTFLCNIGLYYTMGLWLALAIENTRDFALGKFPEIEYSNFDPKHGFLSSIEAEIISFLPNKAANFIFSILRLSFIFSKWLLTQI